MPLQIPHPNTPLHLYRHMLREATYLPPLCRPWITSRIQARFRDCRDKPDPKIYIKDAHHYVRYLRSANAGHSDRMLRLCYLATGRIGKRRRILGKYELVSSPPTDSEELEKRTADFIREVDMQEHDWLENWSTEKIMAIAVSQSEQQAKDWPYQMRRLIDPKKVLPTENCFGRPLSQKLIRNKLKKHWAGVLRQLAVPLPREEWNHLGTLARGEADAQHYTLPPRRPVAQSSSANSADNGDSWSWTDFVTKPVRSLERGNSRKMKSLTGEEDEDPRGHGRAIGVRVLGGRRLRRSIYARVWGATPTIEQNPRSGKWVVAWGQEKKAIPLPRKKDMQFFQGLDAKGRPLQSTIRAATV